MSTPGKAEKQPDIDFNALLQAIKECLLENKPVRTTARAHNLPKSTLDRHMKKVKEAYDDISMVSDDILMDFVRGNRMHLPSNMVNVFSFITPAFPLIIPDFFLDFPGFSLDYPGS